VQKLREHPIGLGGEVVTRYQKRNMPRQTPATPDRAGFPGEGVELYSASFAQAGYGPSPEYVEPIESPVSKPASD
jgi:hypothetical protein